MGISVRIEKGRIDRRDDTSKPSTDATDESEVGNREALPAGPSTEISVDDDTMTAPSKWSQ